MLLLDSLPVVEAAQARAIGLGGEATLASGQDVIDVATLGRHVTARGVGAMPITHLDRPPQRAPEEPLAHADVDDP
jgi:hypothetical protein